MLLFLILQPMYSCGSFEYARKSLKPKSFSSSSVSQMQNPASKSWSVESSSSNPKPSEPCPTSPAAILSAYSANSFSIMGRPYSSQKLRDISSPFIYPLCLSFQEGGLLLKAEVSEGRSALTANKGVVAVLFYAVT